MKIYYPKLTASQQEAKEKLLTTFKIKPSSKLWFIQRSVSRSGMTRKIEVLLPIKGDSQNITWWIAQLMGQKFNESGVNVGGCGMDMHFWLADHLSYLLFGSKKYKSYKGNGGTCLDWKTL